MRTGLGFWWGTLECVCDLFVHVCVLNRDGRVERLPSRCLAGVRTDSRVFLGSHNVALRRHAVYSDDNFHHSYGEMPS